MTAEAPNAPATSLKQSLDKALQQSLRSCGQQHLIDHWATLTPLQQQSFADQLQRVDWLELTNTAANHEDASCTPPDVVGLTDRSAPEHDTQRCVDVGTDAYTAGRVAVLIVAGGQGTRLGFDGPKGCFELNLQGGVKKTIFDLLVGALDEARRACDAAIPLLLMTSPHTDAATRAYFARSEDAENAENAENLSKSPRIFAQTVVPSLDLEGRALLAAPGELLTNPDGHGGCFEALVHSGELARLQAEGVDWLVHLQVDNVLAKPFDPYAVGLAETRGADALTKVLQKRDPDERVGHLVRRGETDAIVEYTELSAEQVRELGEDGQPVFRWGNTAMHVWSVPFLSRLADRDVHLPLHRSRKPLRVWTPDGNAKKTGWKSERFIFDLLAHANVSVGLEVAREDEFAPVKNATGNDSPDTAVQALAARAKR